ncbi:MAG: PIN domain-containing protein [Bdellovibrio sp.]|nr:PIN domain-containing protein [Bdellovibrio sp.]
MLAVDTSSFIAYLQGENGKDVQAIDLALKEQYLSLPPIVLTELLSDYSLNPDFQSLILEVPALEVIYGYFERAGRLRAQVRSKGHKAKLADILIAQSCIDHQVPLISRDRDFLTIRKCSSLQVFT